MLPLPLRLLNPYIVLVNFPDPAAGRSKHPLQDPRPCRIIHNWRLLACFYSTISRNTTVTNISGSAALRQTVRKTFHRVDGLSVAWHFKLLRHETQFIFFLWVLCVVVN